MNPITQTTFGKPDGNCFQACIASILGFDLESLPRYHNDYSNKQWWQNWQNWFACRGYVVLMYAYPDGTTLETAGGAPEGYSIASGKSPRGDFLHSTVALDGKVVHDPHPDRTGILTLTDYIVFVPIDRLPEWFADWREP